MPVAATARQPAAVVSGGGNDDGLGALYELAEQASAAPPPPDATRCPQCRRGLEDDAVLCTNCGYDTRTGKALTTTSVARPAARPGKAAKGPVDLMAPQGSFVAGLAMCAAFAVAASVVWFLVAVVTGFSLSLIAILIGGAAGAGMKIGQKGFSSAGGTAASAITAAAILLAKLAVIECLLAQHRPGTSLMDLNGAKLGYYFFNPIGLIIMVVGMGTAFRTANGGVSN